MDGAFLTGLGGLLRTRDSGQVMLAGPTIKVQSRSEDDGFGVRSFPVGSRKAGGFP